MDIVSMASGRAITLIAALGFVGLAATVALAQVPEARDTRQRNYLERLGRLIEARFANRSVGYAVVAALPSGAFVTRAGGNARHKPDPSPRPMSVDDKLTIASVSKTMTAVAIFKLLARKNLSPDTPVWTYLPSTWTLGEGVKEVTFRQLMGHRAGLRCHGNLGYDTVKECFSTSIVEADKGKVRYNNHDYGVFRIIMPLLEGMPEATLRGLEEQERNGNSEPIADALAERYAQLMNELVFQPAGLPTMYCKVTDAEPALAYRSENTKNPFDFSKLMPGEPWGDLCPRSGAQGWFFSARQLATFIQALTHTQKILPPETVALMKNQELGIFRNNNDGLISYHHIGLHPANATRGEVSTLVIDFSNGVSAGVVVNSKFKGKNNIFKEIVGIVHDAGAVPRVAPIDIPH